MSIGDRIFEGIQWSRKRRRPMRDLDWQSKGLHYCLNKLYLENVLKCK